MKTKNKATAKTMTLTFDQVIFSNRNQAYGAYYLRKNYKKYMLLSLIFITFLFCTIGIVALILSHLKSLPVSKPSITFIPTVIEPTEIPVPFVPTPPEPPRQLANLAVFNSHIIITDSVTSNNNIPVFDQQDSMKPDPIAFNSTGKSGLPDIEENKGLLVVEEPATFQGGDLNKFHDWVQKNLIYPQEAIEVNICGMVSLMFTVDTNGEVCNIKIIKGIHPAVDQEVTRVILNSPKWIPAKNNGVHVKELFTMPVKFKIYESSF
jgi:protein TonB